MIANRQTHHESMNTMTTTVVAFVNIMSKAPLPGVAGAERGGLVAWLRGVVRSAHPRAVRHSLQMLDLSDQLARPEHDAIAVLLLGRGPDNEERLLWAATSSSTAQ